MTTATFELVDGNASLKIPVKKLASHIVRSAGENPSLVTNDDVLFRLMDLASQSQSSLSDDPIDKIVRSLFEEMGPDYVTQELNNLQQAPRVTLRQQFDPSAIQLEPITRKELDGITNILTKDEDSLRGTDFAMESPTYRAINYLARKAFHGASIDGAIRMVGSQPPEVTEQQFLFYQVLKERAHAKETLAAHTDMRNDNWQPA